MGYTLPYRAHNYLGEHTNDTAALVFIRAVKWDSTGNGLGTPRNGMFYYNTTSHALMLYANGTWSNISGGPYSDIVVGLPSSPVTTTSLTDTPVTGMTITPPAGTYCVSFGGDIDNATKGQRIVCSIYSAGSQIVDSERSYTPGGNAYFGSVCCSGRTPVNGSQAIAGYWRTAGSTASIYARTLMIWKVT